MKGEKVNGVAEKCSKKVQHLTYVGVSIFILIHDVALYVRCNLTCYIANPSWRSGTSSFMLVVVIVLGLAHSANEHPNVTLVVSRLLCVFLFVEMITITLFKYC